MASSPTDDAVRAALREDLGEEGLDLTTTAVIDPALRAEAAFIAREAGVVAGIQVAGRVFAHLDPELRLAPCLPEGERFGAGARLATVEGRMAPILTGERVALNFLQRLSGIATLTRAYADALAPHPGVSLLDTRKTTPGLRALERQAVRAGGGGNHRSGLFDAILIKDNHVAAAGGVRAAIAGARRAGLPVEVEVENLEQLDEALAAGAEIILLDNMAPEAMREAVARTAGRARLEASGGITIERAVAAAAAGVDRISVGSLTHSAPALDISLEVTRTWR